MAAPEPVLTLTPPKPAPQSELGYAPARPAGLSPLIDHLGPGYVVVKLPPPSMRLEAARLVMLAVATGVCVAMLGAAPGFLASLERAGWRSVDDLMVLVILGAALVAFVTCAVATVGQGRIVLRRLREPPRRRQLPAGSITFRRAEALTDATDVPTVLRVAVEPSALSWLPGTRGYLRVETTDGRVLVLLQGHGFGTLQRVAAGLRTHLLAPLATLSSMSPVVAKRSKP